MIRVCKAHDKTEEIAEFFGPANQSFRLDSNESLINLVSVVRINAIALETKKHIENQTMKIYIF